VYVYIFVEVEVVLYIDDIDDDELLLLDIYLRESSFFIVWDFGVRCCILGIVGFLECEGRQV